MARKPKTSAEATLTRHSDSAKASKAYAIANSPDFVEFFGALRDDMIRDIEHVELDGSEEKEREALERLRAYQTLMRLKRTIFAPIVKQTLAAHKTSRHGGSQET